MQQYRIAFGATWNKHVCVISERIAVSLDLCKLATGSKLNLVVLIHSGLAAAFCFVSVHMRAGAKSNLVSFS